MKNLGHYSSGDLGTTRARGCKNEIQVVFLLFVVLHFQQTVDTNNHNNCKRQKWESQTTVRTCRCTVISLPSAFCANQPINQFSLNIQPIVFTSTTRFAKNKRYCLLSIQYSAKQREKEYLAATSHLTRAQEEELPAT
jgi:hypothetical protein